MEATGGQILTLLLVVCVNCLVQANSQQLKLGGACTLDNGGQGTCARFQDCPSAVQKIRVGVRPKMCSSTKHSPAVCCPQADVRPITEQELTDPWNWPATSRDQNTNTKSNGKSLEKCKEYGKLVYQNVTHPTLLLEATTSLEADCGRYPSLLLDVDHTALPQEFPHMAALGYNLQGNLDQVEWLCGGSLISDLFVLTAATCVHSNTKGRVRWVTLGDSNMADEDDETSQIKVVVKAISHPLYKSSSSNHNIALLKLGDTVTFDALVRPACLNVDVPTPPGDVAIAAGWRSTRGPDTRLIQDVSKFTLEFHSTAQCNDKYSNLIEKLKLIPEGIDGETMICAGHPERRRDTCLGYSGDPLQNVLTEPYCMYNILGVASFGPGQCREKDVPAVYTRVSHYVPWIESVVWP